MEKNFTVGKTNGIMLKTMRKMQYPHLTCKLIHCNIRLLICWCLENKREINNLNLKNKIEKGTLHNTDD